jgi:Transposase IS66 family
VVRLLTAKLETFRAEDAEVLKAGLSSAPYVTVDDTGARHRGKAGVTTQIGSHNFTVFRTGESKSRQAFLERLCGRVAYYVVNEAALVSMRAHGLAQPLIDKLAGHPSRVFHCQADWMSHLSALGLADLRVAPNPVRVASEGALWGAVREQGLLGQTIVVSDGAGQFRVGEHAACWIHAERLVYKLVPANAIQRNAVVIARRMIWWFYRALKDTRQAPSPENAERLRARFDRVFNRMSTGYATLDKLLKRLFRLKDDLLRVLDHPEIPLNTNASEGDIRVFVTKRKVSGGTVSDRGRDARDVMIGLAKTCAKLKIPFFDYLGARLGAPGRPVPHLATLLRHAPS